MTCPICATPIRPGKQFCGKCGVQVAEDPVPQPDSHAATASPCARCGATVPAGKRFCGACGTAVQVASPPQVAPPPQISHGSLPQARPAQVLPSVATPPRSSFAATIPRPTYVAQPRKPIPKKVLAVAGSGLGLLLILGLWFSRGVDLVIVTDPPGSEVAIDGKTAGVSDPQFGGLTIPQLGRGTHRIEIAHYGFQVWSQPISMGWFRLSRKLNAKLQLPSFPITLSTNPGGVSVQVDGKDAGTSDSSGNLTLQNIQVGRHVFTASYQGYPHWSQAIEVNSAGSLRVDLAALAANQAQQVAAHLQNAQQFMQQQQFQSAMGECQAVLNIDPANQDALNLQNLAQQGISAQAAAAAAQQVNAELSRAQALYQQQQFRAAIEQCDAALKTDPSNQRAKKLRAQIQQTASILGGH
jgi:hypothetical protein